MTLVPIRRGNLDTDTYTEKVPYEDEGKDVQAKESKDC